MMIRKAENNGNDGAVSPQRKPVWTSMLNEHELEDEVMVEGVVDELSIAPTAKGVIESCAKLACGETQTIHDSCI